MENCHFKAASIFVLRKMNSWKAPWGRKILCSGQRRVTFDSTFAKQKSYSKKESLEIWSAGDVNRGPTRDPTSAHSFLLFFSSQSGLDLTLPAKCCFFLGTCVLLKHVITGQVFPWDLMAASSAIWGHKCHLVVQELGKERFFPLQPVAPGEVEALGLFGDTALGVDTDD